jgi:succinoglycan biosynthesis protein ExoA
VVDGLRPRGSVTLIMPVYNEAADIGDVLASLSAQRYPHAALTLLVVDGGSTDGTTAIVADWLAASNIAGTLLHNSRRTIPTSLNLGISQARADDIIIRLDAHTTYDDRYVATIVESFAALPDTVGCVGGPQVPERESRFDRALVAALYTNPMGLGGGEFRRSAGARLARGVYLGAWRPGVLQSVGGFDENWEANEDSELAARLREAGYHTYLVGANAKYRVKRGPVAAVQQWGKYGYWRARTLLRHPREARLRHFVPPLALLAALVLLATPLRLLLAVPYALYCAGVVAKRAPGEAWSVTMASCVFFPACQAAWSAGMLRCLLSYRSPRASVARPRYRKAPMKTTTPGGNA